MRSLLRRAVVVGAGSALCLAGLTPVASAATVAPRTTVDAAPAWTRTAPAVAQTPATATQAMSVVLKLRDAAGAEALAAAVSDPASASYGKYVSAATWRSRFAPTDAQVATVVNWLKAQGFTIGAIPANHRTISFTGTSAQAEKAFATDLKVFAKAGNAVSAPATALSVPTALAGTVQGITGLDHSALATPSHTIGDTPSTKVTGTSSLSATATPKTTLPGPPDVFRNSNPCSAYYGEKAAPNFPQAFQTPLTYVPCGYKPAQLRGAYGLDQALASGYDGRGATVAIVDAFASPTILSDAQTYAATNDPKHPLRSYQFTQNLPLSYRYVDECGGNSWYGEETLDVEAVHAMAPAANILYVGGASCDDSDLDAAVNTVVDNELAQIITNSYGDLGEPDSLADVAGEHQTLLQAAAEGISVMFSSGDDGDDTIDGIGRSVDYEASDPYATAVGGTSLAVGASNDYLFETGWSTTTATLKNGKWGTPAFQTGAGGGTSKLFLQPSYQKGVVPTSISEYFSKTPHRAVPDVAMDADAQTGMLIGETQAFPDGSVRYSQFRIGGTSLASPLFAGLLAVTDQETGRSLGFVNPRLYKFAGTPLLNDIVTPARTVGVVRVNYVNGVDGSDGLVTVLRQFGAKTSIYARPGYDDVTGVGTPNASYFVSYFGSDKTPGKASGGRPSGTGTPARNQPIR